MKMIISGRLAKIERKMDGFGRESQEELLKNEEEMRVSFEQTLNRLEVQKDKNLMKISKDNEFKQLQPARRNPKTFEQNPLF